MSGSVAESWNLDVQARSSEGLTGNYVGFWNLNVYTLSGITPPARTHLHTFLNNFTNWGPNIKNIWSFGGISIQTMLGYIVLSVTYYKNLFSFLIYE